MEDDDVSRGLDELFDASGVQHTDSLVDKLSYVPLEKGHVRILRLLPAQDGDHMYAQLIHTPFAEAGKRYYALSYVWGQQQQDRIPLRLAYGDSQYNITVGHNLGQALRQLYPKDDHIPIWIDAICIDQGNNEEKLHQVAMMADIYRNCGSVLGWMGPSDGATKALFTRLKLLAKMVTQMIKSPEYITPLYRRKFIQKYLLMKWQFIYDPKSLTLVEQLATRVQHEWLADPQPADAHYQTLLMILLDEAGIFNSGTSTLLKDCHDFCGLEWWRRLWITQEYVLAPKISFLCGESLLEQETLMLAIEACSAAVDLIDPYQFQTQDIPWLSKAFLSSPATGYPNFWLVHELAGLPQSLEEASKEDSSQHPLLILAYFNNIPVRTKDGPRAKGATDDRDRIYALLSMSDDRLSIVPDYTKTTKEVYTQFSEAFLTRGYLPLLWLLRLSNNALSLPSWCIDWSALQAANELSKRVVEKHMASRCAIEPTFATLNSENGDMRTMTIRAYPLGRIAHVYAPVKEAHKIHPSCSAKPGEANPEDKANHFANCHGIWELWTLLRQRFSSEEEALYQLLRFVSEPRPDHTPTPGVEPQTATSYCNGLLRSVTMRSDQALYEHSMVQAWTAIVDGFQYLHKGNCTALSEDGDVGCVYEEAQIGDMLIGLKEYEAPLILREVGEGLWKIVGCAWFPTLRERVKSQEAALLQSFCII